MKEKEEEEKPKQDEKEKEKSSKQDEAESELPVPREKEKEEKEKEKSKQDEPESELVTPSDKILPKVIGTTVLGLAAKKLAEKLRREAPQNPEYETLDQSSDDDDDDDNEDDDEDDNEDGDEDDGDIYETDDTDNSDSDDGDEGRPFIRKQNLDLGSEEEEEEEPSILTRIPLDRGRPQPFEYPDEEEKQPLIIPRRPYAPTSFESPFSFERTAIPALKTGVDIIGKTIHVVGKGIGFITAVFPWLPK